MLKTPAATAISKYQVVLNLVIQEVTCRTYFGGHVSVSYPNNKTSAGVDLVNGPSSVPHYTTGAIRHRYTAYLMWMGSAC